MESSVTSPVPDRMPDPIVVGASPLRRALITTSAIVGAVLSVAGGVAATGLPSTASEAPAPASDTACTTATALLAAQLQREGTVLREAADLPGMSRDSDQVHAFADTLTAAGTTIVADPVLVADYREKVAATFTSAGAVGHTGLAVSPAPMRPTTTALLAARYAAANQRLAAEIVARCPATATQSTITSMARR